MPTLVKKKIVGNHTVKLLEKLPGEEYATRYAVLVYDQDDISVWGHHDFAAFTSDRSHAERRFVKSILAVEETFYMQEANT